MHLPISQNMFIHLCGEIGTEGFRRHRNGSSWIIPDGRIASELFDGKKWNWFLTK